MRLWIVEAPSQPLRRITSAALPVKAANRTLPSTPSARCRASVVLPVPAKPNRRNNGGVPLCPGLALSQLATALNAASCWGENAGMGWAPPGLVPSGRRRSGADREIIGEPILHDAAHPRIALGEHEMIRV